MDHVFGDVIPQRVVVGIADNDAFNGPFRPNPFNFKNNYMATDTDRLSWNLIG